MYGRSTAAPQAHKIDPIRPNPFFLLSHECLLALTVCLAAFSAAPSVTQAQTAAPASTPTKEPEHPTDWTHWVRIGAFGLRSDAQAD
ncbi:MAG TPA: hypothetical protein VHP80_15795, partial [Candidatus Acidoferrum sp.]|nr:hypothetical protein [Candidatus Acidoferrum sp.]